MKLVVLHNAGFKPTKLSRSCRPRWIRAEVAIEAAPRIEGGQHLNVNVLKRETLEDAAPTQRITHS